MGIAKRKFMNTLLKNAKTVKPNCMAPMQRAASARLGSGPLSKKRTAAAVSRRSKTIMVTNSVKPTSPVSARLCM
jgi:hypothetical protein